MSDPNDLHAFLAEGWRHLTRGVADGRSPARYPTFATVSQSGKPQARTVALRAAYPSEALVEVHTDIETAKITALRHAPYAALHIWLPKSDLQIRLTTKVDIITGPQVDTQWAKIPPASRVSYGTNPAPGTAITSVFAYEKPAERTRFAVLKCRVEEIDLVHLGLQHKRAIFRHENGFAGTWVAP
jgi:pyridoxamine 5'-phosphate oxidase